MNSLNQYYDFSAQLIAVLRNEKDADKKIEQVNILIDKRQSLLKEISPPFSEVEMEVGSMLIKMEKIINDLLSREKLRIQKDIKNLSITKESSQKYLNPYQSLSTDGIFYDKRK